MNKRELVESIAGQVEVSKQQVEAVIDRFIETVGSTLKKGEKLALTGFGAFEARQRAARTGQNPQTGEKLQIPATVVPAFKPGQALRAEVAGGPAKKSAGKKAAKKAGKKAAGKKAAGKKTAKKAGAKKAAGKKTAGKKTAKKAGAKKAAPKKAAKKAGAKKAAAKKAVRKSIKKTAKKR